MVVPDAVPEGRCGFVLHPQDLDLDPEKLQPADNFDYDRWYRRHSVKCCWLVSWEGSDTGRCVWHAEVEDKSLDNLSGLFARTEGVVGAFLRKANLKGADLSGAVLRGADLSEADLSEADFSKANLSDADLSWAHLDGVDLSEANLSGATLSGTYLSGATLSGTYLNGADLSGTYLDRADLSGKSLRDADLSGADLRGADLSEATLLGADISGAVLEGTDFSGASLNRADLVVAHTTTGTLHAGEPPVCEFSGAELREADLSGAELREADLSGAELREADLSGTSLNGADLSGADLQKADFSETNLQAAELPNGFESDLSPATLTEADLSGVNLRDADLSGVNLRGADLSEALLWDADLSGADLNRADLSGAGLLEADLLEADLSMAKLTDADLLDADLSDAHLIRALLSDTTLGPTRRVELGFGSEYKRRRFELVARQLHHSEVESSPADCSDSPTDTPHRTTLTKANLFRADLSRADFSYTDLAGADIREAILTDTILSEATLVAADIRFTDLSEERLRGIDFSRARLERADFSGADLINARFSYADLRGAIFDHAECRRSNFTRADVERASFIGADLRAAQFDGANVYQAIFTECQMDSDTTIETAYTYDESASVPASFLRRVGRRIKEIYERISRQRTSTDQREERTSVDEVIESPASAGGPGADRAAERGNKERIAESGIEAEERETGRSTQNALGRSVEGTTPDAETADRTGDETAASSLEPQSERCPRIDESTRYERAALTYDTIHRLLTRHGRTHEARNANYYRDAQRARIKQAETDRAPFRFARVLLAYILILMSESLRSLLLAVLIVTTVFTGIYWAVGGVISASAGVTGIIRLFIFSLLTLFEGTYAIATAAIPFGVVKQLEPMGLLLFEGIGVADLKPATSAGRRIVVIERGIGVLLIVPFVLLFIQRLRLYAQTTTTEGTGGLTSWLFGK